MTNNSLKKRLILVTVFVISVLLISKLSLHSAQRPVRIGIASMITPVDAVKYYQEIVDYVGDRLGMPVEMVLRRTYDEMDKMLEKGTVDIAFICSAPYVKNRREFGVELLVAPEVNGRPFYKSYIIVHKDSPFKRFEDLKGHTFAFTDPKSNSGRLYPVYRLAKKGLRPEEFFKKYIYSYSHNKSVELVAKRIVDGAAVESLVYEYMKKQGNPYVQETKIIERSPDFGIPPVVVSTGVSLFVKEKIKEILLNMHRTAEGKRILSAMNIDRFVEVPDSNYDSIREMERVVSRLSPPSKKQKKDDSVIYFGVIPRDNPRITYEKYQPLIDYLTETTGHRFELKLKKSYEETVVSLGNGETDVAILDPLTYLEAHARYGAVCILKSVNSRGEPFYYSMIITKKDKPLKSLSELKGKSFAFSAVKSTAGNLIPRYLLAEAGIHLKDLGMYKNFDYHETVVKRVLSGEFDAGAVRDSVANKYMPLGIKVIKRSSPIPTGPVVIGPRTSFVTGEMIKSALININKTERGQQVLKKLDPEFWGGFIEARDSDYQGIRDMINNVPKTCGMGCHPKIKL